MNRRQFLLGATTVVGGGAFAKANADKIPPINPNEIIPEPNLDSDSNAAQNESEAFKEVAKQDMAEIKRWRWNADHAGHGDANNYDGWAMTEVKNLHDKTLDFKVKWTPVHKNGSTLKTHGESHKIKPLEYKKYTEDWESDDSSRYVDTLRIEVLVSDQAWFNGWETIIQKEYEF